MNNSSHHYMGIEMNRQTWSLLDKKYRSEQDDIRMINYAKDSLYHWRKSDKYIILNEQRGKWLISRVYAILKKPDEALSYAKETLKITKGNNFKDFNLAYAYEAMTRVYSIANKQNESKECTRRQKLLEI